MGNNLLSDSKGKTVIDCPTHESVYNGVCGDKNCYEEGLVCFKCNPTSCILTKDHELVSIDEFYLRFLAKPSGGVDFQKISEIIENLRRIDRDYLNTQIENFSKRTESLIDEKLNNLNENIINKLEVMKKNVNARLESIKQEYLDADSRLDLANFDVPENFSLEETKKFFEKNSKSVKDMENMINLVKKYSDNEKLLSNQRDMETILYAKNLADLSNKDIIEEKIEAILREFKDDLNDLLSLVVYHKKSSSIILSKIKKFGSNPCELKFKQDISLLAQRSYTIDSIFTAYTTVEGNSYIAWANPSHAIDVYDLKTNSIVKSLTGHTQHVYIVRHFYYSKEKTDYLLTTSYERSCKVWNANTLTLTITIGKCHTGFYLYSALLLFDDLNQKAFIVTTAPNEMTKVWNINTGAHIKDIGTTTDYTYFINTWYDKKNNEIYIVNANSTNVKIYDFKNEAKCKTFKSEVSTWHMSALVHYIKDVPYLFETDGNGYLRIWDIDTELVFKTIHAADCNFRGLCVWNDQYIITASSDKSFKVFDLNTFTIAATIKGHDNVLCTVDKVVHPIYGEVLLTSAIDGKIKLWVGANNKW